MVILEDGNLLLISLISKRYLLFALTLILLVFVFDISNTYSQQSLSPVITSITLDSEKVSEGTRLTLTVRATSNSPVEWFNGSFYGPHGNIWGGGHGGPGMFTEISPGLWEYIKHDIVSKYAPTGDYYYENISVKNAGMLTSETWPGELSVYITSSIEPEEKEVVPENGSATVNFPLSNVVITIETDEPGTITVTRYPSHSSSSPEGSTSAGIFLDINPSANLQGKPATFTVGYSLPLPDGVDESTLKLYRWSGSGWSVLPSQTLDTIAKTITASVDSFSTFGVFGSSASPSSDPSSSFKKIVNRYLNIVNYSGQIEHEHTFSFAGGLAGMIAIGKGDLGGVHSGTEVESIQRRSVTSTEFYNLKTHADALPGDYLRVVSGTSNHNNHTSQLGVEAKPGEVAVINENIATGSDRGGSYFGYRGYLYSSEGRNRMEVGSYGASVSFDVEGTSEVYVSITNQDGSTSAGWWNIE